MANCPDVSVTTVIKDRTEWEEFVDAVVRSYGFNIKSDPLIYTLQGDLIGDGSRFVDHLRNTYNIHLTLTKETLKNRQRKNIYDNEERMRKRGGRTFGEEIEAVIIEKPKKNVSKLITDSFYTQEFDNGVSFFVRRTNLLREDANKKFTARRMINVPDYELEEKKKKDEEAAAKANEDLSWESFLKSYTRHIEKKVDPMIRTANRKERDFGWEPADDEAVEINTKKSKTSKTVSRDETNSSKMSIIPDSELKIVPDDCQFSFLRKNIVSELSNDYLMVNHPFPTIEGEMLIFQNNLETPENSN